MNSIVSASTLFIFLTGLFGYQNLYSADDKFAVEADQYSTTTGILEAKMYIPIFVGETNVVIPVNIEIPESQQTLQGFDLDSNGIRDDVQNAIVEKYEDDTYLMNRSLLMAKEIQKIVTGQVSDFHRIFTSISELDKCMRNYILTVWIVRLKLFRLY